MRSRTWGLTSSAPTPSTKAARPPRSLWAHSASVYICSITDNLFPVERSSAFPQSSLFSILIPWHHDSETPATPTSRSTSISRSGSTPVVLANGKPLKPSLKSSASSPHIGDWRAQHPRSRSEPTTPSGPKTVHFPEKKDSLESVVVFEKTARPRAVSGAADDTETETEGYDSPANAGFFQNYPSPSADSSQ
ncbi:hypothetical protein FS842_001142, partial [Serendipita sp. 407]